MPNPYLWRTTITNPQCFYGRKEEIEAIYERIKSEDPQSTAVISERKMGKSSLLYYVYHEREKYLVDPEKYLFIFIDLQGETINSRDDFFRVLLDKLNERLRDNIVVDKKVDSYETIRKIVSELDKAECKLILFLDEFDLLVRKESIPPELYENLRSLAGMYAVAYITATVKSPIELAKEYGSPFFNIFFEEPLGPFSKEAAIELIEVPSAREGVPLKKEAEFVLDIAGLYPYFIQIACSILFRYKTKKEHLRKSDYDEIREKFMKDAGYQFEHIWRHLNKEEKEVLLKVVKSKSISERKKYVLEDLRRKGYVIKKGKGHKIFSSIFKDFVAGRKGKREEKNEDRTLRYTPVRVLILLSIAGLAGAIIVLVSGKDHDLVEMFFTNLLATVAASFLLILIIHQIYHYKRIEYTRMIDLAYRKHPENSQELYEELNRIKRKLSDEMSGRGAFGSLKSLICEKAYGERLVKKIDDSRTEVFAGMISGRFESIPTDLDAHMEKMLTDKKVTKAEYEMFMNALSKSDMKEEDKKELENVIVKWVEKE